ncbi:MAG: DUF2177 family protein [Alphaproteobacteria bacterium]|nr:DUF2177 family protein [Alphaproteobacteria bacterium]
MFLILYALTLTIYIALDLLWVGVIANKFYYFYVGDLLRADPNWIAALLFYLIFALGLLVFVIFPAIEKNSIIHAFMYGAFFGLVCYATYDLTNLALTKNWSIIVTVVDILWGAVIASVVSGSTYYIASKFFY